MSNNIKLLEQVAQFAMAAHEPPESFVGGSAEWGLVLITEAEKFCEVYQGTDWGVVDWYETTDQWIEKFLNELSEA